MENKNIDLRLCIDKQSNINLKDLSQALNSLDDLLKEHFLTQSGDSESTIYLKGVEKGSSIFNFCVEFSQFIIATGQIKEIIESFFALLNKLFCITAQKSIDEIKNDDFYTPKNINDIKNITKLSSDGNTAEIYLAIQNSNFENCNFTLTPQGAEIINENLLIVSKIKNLDTQMTKSEIFQSVLIKFKQVKESEKIVQDLAICDDAVKGKAIKTIIENLDDKNEIIANNAFLNYFLVDLIALKIDGQVKLYKITKLHNIIPISSKKEQNSNLF